MSTADVAAVAQPMPLGPCRTGQSDRLVTVSEREFERMRRAVWFHTLDATNSVRLRLGERRDALVSDLDLDAVAGLHDRAVAADVSAWQLCGVMDALAAVEAVQWRLEAGVQ